MIDPYELVDNLVAALQDIEDFVAAMGADAWRPPSCSNTR